jgi:caffeoyl-CoA O-methyltransferase
MRYCEAHSSAEPAHLDALVRYTWLNTLNPRQLCGHLQGRLLSMLSCLMQPRCILEIGTFTGYSALCMAEGLKEDGILHSIEADGETAFKAAEFIKGSPFAGKITMHTGDALKLIPELRLEPNIVFVDAAKQQYPDYFKVCLPILASGGLMLFDNTLWSQKVLDDEMRTTDADTAAMHQFNEFLLKSEGIEVLMLPLRDGLTLIRKH